MRRRLILAAAVVVVVAVGLTVTVVASRSGSPPAATHTALTTATVQRTDLAESTPVDGVVAYGSPQSIVQPGGTDPSALDQHRQAATAAQLAVAADRQAAADARAVDDQGVAQAQQSVASAQAALDADTDALNSDQASAADERTITADQQRVTADQAAVATAQGQVRAAQLKSAQDADQAQAKLAADELVAASASAAAAGSQASQTSYGSTSRYTSLPAVGQVIQPGQALWSVDGHPTALLPGSLVPWRAFVRGMAPGPDVAALDQALLQLGDGAGLSPSNDFTGATAAAIGRLQAASGQPATGALPLGSVVFAPAAVRVAAVHPQLGAPVAGGAPVLDVTSTTPIVEVALPVEQSYLVKVGDPVTVTLADQTTSTGSVSAVGTVATAAPPADGSSGSSGSSGPPSATISVAITLARTGGTASLDQAPVTVHITNATVTAVLAAPTTALVALGGGGYALEVVEPHGTHRLVPITTGLFDDQAGLVQVSGPGLVAGQKVVAPA